MTMSIGLTSSRPKCTPPRKTERRSALRHPVNPEASHIAWVAGSIQPARGRVRDIAVDGIGVLLAAQPAEGELINLQVTSKSGLFARTLELQPHRVVAQKDGTYLVGGTIVTQLSGEELEALLR
jgi:hypothetical protein